MVRYSSSIVAMAIKGQFLWLIILLCFPSNCMLEELFTLGTQIVNFSGERVRLKCVNWYGAHMELFVAGGMEVNSITNITRQINSMGSNCVRLPFSMDLWRLNPLVQTRAIGPWIISECALSNLSAMAIFDCQIRILTDAGIYVILNNHNSWASWVGTDGVAAQGLWDMPNYTAYDWLDCLEQMSTRYRDNLMVVGMDIRNEPFDCYNVQITWGKSDNIRTDWKAASSMAAERIEKVNPKMLIIVSGLCKGYDLNDMIQSLGPENALIRRKLVYTTHVYTFAFWWVMFDWQKVYWISLVVFVLSAVIGARLYEEFQTIPFPGYTVMFGATGIVFGPFAFVWLCISVGWVYIVRLLGCSCLEKDAYPLMAISCALVAASICSVCKLWPPKKNSRVILSMVLCSMISLHATGLFFLSVVSQSYTMVENELMSRWQLQTVQVPVWVGEFGAAWYDQSLVWAFVLRYLKVHDLDFAYWPLNGKKWWQPYNRYTDEDYGLLDVTYTRLRNPRLVSFLFNASSTVTY